MSQRANSVIIQTRQRRFWVRTGSGGVRAAGLAGPGPEGRAPFRVSLQRVLISGSALSRQTPVEDVPLAIAPFQGRVLVGVGKLLRIYDMGKKKLLRKCENKVRTLGSGPARMGRTSHQNRRHATACGVKGHPAPAIRNHFLSHDARGSPRPRSGSARWLWTRGVLMVLVLLSPPSTSPTW